MSGAHILSRNQFIFNSWNWFLSLHYTFLTFLFYFFMSDKIHVVERKDQQTYESGSDPKQSTGPYTHYPASYMDGLLDQESLFNRLDR